MVVVDVAGRDRRDAAGALDRVGEVLGRGGGHRLGGVPAGEDVDDHDLVGAGERRGEVVEQERCARVHVRLEDGPQPAIRSDALSRGLERRAHLGRVVRVVVEDRHAASIRDELHAASGSAERCQAIREPVEVRAEGAGQHQGRGGVADVVLPGQLHREATVEQRERRALAARRRRQLAAISPPGP